MAYDWTQLGNKEITNWYLYGRSTTPSDLTDGALIRPKDVSNAVRYGANIEVNMASYMTGGPGRFALGSESDLVQAFFSININLSWMAPGVQYSKTDIITRLGLSVDSDEIRVKQSLLSDTASDYLQRAYIWNAGLFRVANDVTFSVNAQGQRSIQNYSVRPFNENFDFEFGGIIAGVANSVLQPAIDPWEIGRKVNIAFVDDGLPKTTYTLADLSSEGLQHISHTISGSASALLLGPVGMLSIVDDLWTSGVTRTIHQGKTIIYGSADAETLSASKVETLPAGSPLGGYADLTANNGVVLVSGAGADTLNGGMGNDVLFGGDGQDLYQFTGTWGKDLIADTDRSGSIQIDGQTIGHAKGAGQLNTWVAVLGAGSGLFVDMTVYDDARSSTGKRRMAQAAI
jgi:hypothetical protein